MTTKTFHIGDILSVTTGKLVSLDHIGGVYNLLGHMVGEDLMTHQLPRVSDECTPSLLAQFPDLPTSAPEFVDEAHVWHWLEEQVQRFGSTRDVAPLASAEHTVIDPLDEIRMIRPDLPVVVIETGGQS